MIKFDPDSAACAGSLTPDYWSEKPNHRLASKICFGCSEQIDCYFTALTQRQIGTWGGVWFPPAIGSETGRHAIYLRTGTGSTPLSRLLPMATAELCRRMKISLREFRARYGTGELSVYCALTGKEPDSVKVARSA